MSKETDELTTLRAQLAEAEMHRDGYAHQLEVLQKMLQDSNSTRAMEREMDAEQLAQVQREAAHLREAVVALSDGRFDELPIGEAVVKLDAITKAALSSDAGKGYLTDSECQARVDAAVQRCVEAADSWLERCQLPERGLLSAIRHEDE